MTDFSGHDSPEFPCDWNPGAGRKVSRLVPRTVPLEQTERRLRACLHLVPVTRLTDLTPLDRLALPVVSAVTPLARDLTTHLGKGLTAEAARVSAMMEAVERSSAERTPTEIRVGSYTGLLAAGLPAVDPRRFELPSDTSFTPDGEITWVPAREVNGGAASWLPLDLAISPPVEGILRDVDTNGLAAGNTILEAIVHALGEVIERDAVAQNVFRLWYAEHPPPERVIDLDSLPDSARGWVARIREAGLVVALADVTADVPVPTFKAVVADPAFARGDGHEARMFVGYGTDACSEVAATRAITEAVQSRLAVVQGARDSFNRSPAIWRPATWQHQLRLFQPGPVTPLATVPGFETNDLERELRFILHALTRAGFPEVHTVDLTRPDLGIPVVRVRVAGLTSFLANRRRLNWRCLRHLI